jgi:hypothetical protein
MDPFYSKVYLKYERLWKTCADCLMGRRAYFRDTLGAMGELKGDLVKCMADREYNGYEMDLLRFEVMRNEHVTPTEIMDTRWLGDPDLRRVPRAVRYTAAQCKAISYMSRLEKHHYGSGHVLEIGSDPGAGAKAVMTGLIHNMPCRNIGPELKGTLIISADTASWERQLDKFSDPILKWITLKRPTDLRKLAFAAQADVAIVTPRFMSTHYDRFKNGPAWHRYIFCDGIGFPIEAKTIWSMEPHILGDEHVKLRHVVYTVPVPCKETDYICRVPNVTHVDALAELADHVHGYMDDVTATECCICYGPSDTVHAKCGHVLCYECATKISSCPKCRMQYADERDIVTTADVVYIFPLVDVLRKVIPDTGNVVVISFLAHKLVEVLGPVYGARVQFQLLPGTDHDDVQTVIDTSMDYISMAKTAHAGLGDGVLCVKLVPRG